LPVAGSIGTWPEQNSSPPDRTAWLYGPAGAGASGAITASRWDTFDVLSDLRGSSGH
jgi:hypothetical protein